jgi:hypothetical protein
VILNVKPKISHAIEVKKSGYATQVIEGITIDSDQIKQLPPIVLRQEFTGFTLDSAPSGAKVLLDGQELAQRTPVKITDLTAGTHRIRVAYEGYSPWETQIESRSGVVVAMPTAELVANAASPSAAKAAVAKPIHPKAPAESSEAPSENKPRRPIVLLAQGILRINTRPTGSQVYIDGQLIGNTPQYGIKLEPGPHQVTLKNNEYNLSKSVTLDIPPGETVDRTYDFVPEP